MTQSTLIRASVAPASGGPPPKDPPSPKVIVASEEEPEHQADLVRECLRAMAQTRELSDDRDQRSEARLGQLEKLARPLGSRVGVLEERQNSLIDRLGHLSGRMTAVEGRSPSPSYPQSTFYGGRIWRRPSMAILALILILLGCTVVWQQAQLRRLETGLERQRSAIQTIVGFLKSRENPSP
jgi:hypothetical protein